MVEGAAPNFYNCRAIHPWRTYGRSQSPGFSMVSSYFSKSISNCTMPCALCSGLRPAWCSKSLKKNRTSSAERTVENTASWLLKGERNPLPTASVSISSPKRMSGNSARKASRAAERCATRSVFDPMQSKQGCFFFIINIKLVQMYEMFLLLLHESQKRNQP